MNIIDCKSVRDKILNEIKGKTDGLSLRIICTTDDDASKIYIKNKKKMCEKLNIKCDIDDMSKCNRMQLLRYIRVLNMDSCVTGIIVQLPLKEDLKPYQQEILDAIDWEKDVDGLSSVNVGKLWTNQECIVPATAQGVMELLPKSLKCKKILIAGRSDLVGKPLIKLLLDRNATVSVAHSKSFGSFYDLSIQCDYFISAIGVPKYYGKLGFIYEHLGVDCCQPIKMIDVGINRDEEGRLCGDIDIEHFTNYDVSITPVPNGIGLLTVACLMRNIVKAKNLQERRNLIG